MRKISKIRLLLFVAIIIFMTSLFSGNIVAEVSEENSEIESSKRLISDLGVDTHGITIMVSLI